MSWVLVPLPALVLITLVGAALDRAAGLGFSGAGAWRWAPRALLGLVLAVGCVVHPWAGAALGMVVVWWSRTRGALPGRGPSTERTGVWFLLAVLTVMLLRPPGVLYWDEAVWLAKVRLAAGDPWRLVTASLDPSSDVVPRGYPVFASLAQSAFAGLRSDTPSLVAGAVALAALCIAMALAMLPAARRTGVVFWLALAPLSWVHLRSAYLDLPLGSLALAVAAGLARGEPWARRSAVLAACLAAGMKDEGLVHVLAIAAAHTLASERRAEAGRAAAEVVAGALLSWGTWRVLLSVHGVSSGDHALSGAGLAEAGDIALAVVRAAADVRSWGLLWPLVGAAALVSWSGARSTARPVAHALAWQLAGLVLALVLGTERLRVFALDGSLVNRLWMQLAPMGAWLLAEALAARPPGAPHAPHATNDAPS